MIDWDNERRKRVTKLLWSLRQSNNFSIGQGIITHLGNPGIPIHMFRIYHKFSFLEYQYNMHYVPSENFFYVSCVEYDTNKIEGDRVSYDSFNLSGEHCDDVITAFEDRYGMMFRDS